MFPVGADLSEIRLDGLVLWEDDKTVVECKYKIVQDPQTKEFSPSAIAADDIYQVVAYSVHEKVQAGSAILVYPSDRSAGDGVQPAAEIRSFRGASLIPVTIVLMDLQAPAESHALGLKQVFTDRKRAA